MPPFKDFGGLYHACLSIQRRILPHAWGEFSPYPGLAIWLLDNQADGPGVRPTGPNTRRVASAERSTAVTYVPLVVRLNVHNVDKQFCIRLKN